MTTHASTAPGSSRAGLLSAAGAVLAALLASACCWIPLVLIGAGASAMGAAAFFEAYRPLFLAVTGLLLGAGYYFVYLREPKCAPGSACATPDPRLRKVQRASLWGATALVLVFASFPSYVGTLLGGDEPTPAAGATPAAATAATAAAQDTTRVYAVEGMSCESCAARLQKKLGQIPGVKSAKISFDAGTATVVFEPGRVDDDAVLRTITDAGFTGHPAANPSGPRS